MKIIDKFIKKLTSLFLDDHFILALIIINAVLIFVQEFKFVPEWLPHLDSIFTLLFTFELTLKIRTYGFRSYWKSGWNRMDFILVMLALFSTVQIFVGREVVPLNFLLTLRVLRAFKSFRLFRFIPNISDLVTGVQRAIRASYLILLAFFILTFVVSILTCSLFKHIAPEYFDTPLNSLYSIFRVFSSDGWHEIPDLIASRSTVWGAVLTKTYFVAILFIGGILGMSIVNSIFVQAMLSDSNYELNTKIDELTGKIDRLMGEPKNTEEKG